MLVYNTLFSRILQEGNAYFLENFYRGGTRRFPALVDRGIRTAAGGFGLTGRLLFLHRRTGVLELRQRVRPFRAESFPLNLSEGIRRLRTAGTLRRPPRGRRRTHGGGQKGRTTCGFPSSLNSYLSLAS